MYYSLRQNYVLRGWKRLTGVLVKRPYNVTKVLNQTQLNLMLLCDGSTDFDEEILSGDERDFLHKCIENGIVACGESEAPVSEEQLYRYYDNRYVQSIFWSVTGRCNFRCRHCYMDAPDAKLGEISHEQAMRLIDQMNDCGVLRVDITGGEAFVREDFWDIVDRLLHYKIHIGIVYTNAWMLNDKMLDKFMERGLYPTFCVSFDGIGWHDWMRGVKGAEQAAMRAFRLCHERGFTVTAQYVLHRGSWNGIRETVKALADAGVQMVRIGPIKSTELWEKNGEGNTISTREYYDKVLEYIPQFFEDGMPMDILCGGMVILSKDSTKYSVPKEHGDKNENGHLCDSARYSCYITPEGRLLPCIPMTACDEQEQFPLIEDIGLKQGLTDGYYMQYVDSRVRDLFARNEQCNACEYRLRCGGGCRANALMSGNGLMGADPEACTFWHGHYAEKIHQVADAAIKKYCTSEERQ